MATSLEVEKRNGGCGVVFEGKLYIWGGETTRRETLLDLIGAADGEGEEEEGLSDPYDVVVTLPCPDDNDGEHPLMPFDVFDFQTHLWSRQPTSGEVIPSVGLGSSLVVHLPSRSFVLHGGWNGGSFDSEVYRVSADTWRWVLMEPSTPVKPTPRYLTGVVVHRDRLCVFGGVSPDIKSDPHDPGAEYVEYVDPKSGDGLGFGWNNEYFEFEFSSSESVSLQLNYRSSKTVSLLEVDRPLFVRAHQLALWPAIAQYHHLHRDPISSPIGKATTTLE